MKKAITMIFAFALLASFAFAIDSDGDGVYDHADLCENTDLNESITYSNLRINRFALLDGDDIFDTIRRGNIKSSTFNTLDTCGCSCEQIGEYTEVQTGYGLGKGHVKYGCTRSLIEGFSDEYCNLVEDCNGELGGEASFDQCGTCVEGQTGKLPCVQDCNGDFGGAYVDECDTCVGGNTGKTECSGVCFETDDGVDIFNFGMIINHSITGTNLVDVCLPLSNYLFERHCEANDPANFTVLVDCTDYDMICSGGACVEPVQTCTESDGGLNLFEAGILELSNLHSSGNLTDTCTGVSEGLAEYVCMPDGCGYQVVYPTLLRVNPEYMLVYDNGDCTYATTNGGYTANCETEGKVCQNGACVEPEVPACLDTDGGVDFFTPGTIINHSVTRTNLVDVCLTNSEYLFERHCESDNPENYTVLIDCLDFNMTCQAGACV